jgi:hypothetical protein
MKISNLVGYVRYNGVSANWSSTVSNTKIEVVKILLRQYVLLHYLSRAQISNTVAYVFQPAVGKKIVAKV